jgi:hypothetical protein
MSARAVGAVVADPAAVRAAEGLHVLGRAHGQHVLAAARRAHGGRPPAPALPAAKTMVISWLPATGTAEAVGWASRTSASYCWQDRS